MQQFTVPQFIDVEDKIFGPITTRQFLIILASSIVVAISYKIFDFSLFVLVLIIVSLFCMLFAFARVNGRPFHFFVLNFIQTVKRANLRVWNNNSSEMIIEQMDAIIEKPVNHAQAPSIPTSRLDELSLIVDTSGAYMGEDKN